MAPRLNTSDIIARTDHRLSFNADIAAIVLAVALAAMVRLNVLPGISF